MAIKAVAFTGKDALVRVVDQASGSSVALPSNFSREIHSCTFSQDGRFLAIGTASTPGIIVYDTDTWATVLATPSFGSVWKMCFSPDGSMLVAAVPESPYFAIYSTTTWEKITPPISLAGYGASCCAFSRDGSLLAFTHGVTSIYKTSDWSKVSTPALTQNAPEFCCFSPDGAFFAVAGSSPALTVYSTATWTSVPGGTYSGAYGKSCGFSPDGTKFALTIDRSPGVVFFSVGAWTGLTAPAVFVDHPARTCEFSPDGLLLFIGSIRAPFLTVVNVGTLTKLPHAFGIVSEVSGIAFVDAGARYIRANVRDISGDPAQRTMRVRLRRDGTRQAEVVSDPVTGDVEAKVYGGDVEYDAQFMAASGEPLNDLFFARVSSSET